MLFTANLHCADLEQALEQEVVASLPSKSCPPTILYDVSLLIHSTPFYDVETLLDFLHAVFEVCFKYLGSRE